MNRSKEQLIVATVLVVILSLMIVSSLRAAQISVELTKQAYMPYISKSLSDTSTPTPTITPTRTMTPAASVTPTATAAPRLSLSVGAGGSDVIPHQIVRAGDDRVYIFTMQQYSALIRVFTTVLPGLPNTSGEFLLKAMVTEPGFPISIDAVYDGQDMIHVLVNTKDTGVVLDYPFNIVQGTFLPAINIANDSHKISGDYIGTSGISGSYDKTGLLQLAYWTNTDEIRHRAYRYNPTTNGLVQEGMDTVMTSVGSENHPVVAVSPVDNRLFVAWVNTAGANTVIQIRSRAPDGSWGGISTISKSPVWKSTSAGVNIDQGPSMFVDMNGIPHLVYIEDYDLTGDYGRVHHLYPLAGNWVDQALSVYSHDPALAFNSRGEIYLVGHGHPLNATCKDMRDMCTARQNSDGTWANPVEFAVNDPSTSFDGSPSVKWSAVGFNRPETIEFVFFRITNGDYNNPTIYYGRLP